MYIVPFEEFSGAIHSVPLELRDNPENYPNTIPNTKSRPEKFVKISIIQFLTI